MTEIGLALASAIDELPRDEFRRIFVNGLCRTVEFGHLVAAGASDLDGREKMAITNALSSHFNLRAYPLFDTDLFDDDLTFIARVVAARSVELR